MKEKYKILLVHNYYRNRFIGGEDIVYNNEFEALKEELGKDNVFKYISTNEEIKNYKKIFSIWFSNKHYKNLLKIIKGKNIDVVHFHNIFFDLTPSVIKAAHDAGAKVIQTLHNFRWWCPNGVLYNQKLNNTCHKCVSKIFPYSSIIYKCNYNSFLYSAFISCINSFYKFKGYIKLIDKFIVMTEFSKNLIMQYGVPSNKIIIKPNYIDSPYVRKKKRNEKKYLYIGRIDDYKGINLLVETWIKYFDNLELNIVGAGDLEDHVNDICKKQKNIIYHGKASREKVFKHIKNASFLIMPSLLYETFGLTTLEAMSLGLPVIGSNLGTRKEFIKNNYNGYLFNPNIDELRKAIIKTTKLNDQQYEELSNNAYKFSLNFKKDKVTNQLLEIYEGILNE